MAVFMITLENNSYFFHDCSICDSFLKLLTQLTFRLTDLFLWYTHKGMTFRHGNLESLVLKTKSKCQKSIETSTIHGQVLNEFLGIFIWEFQVDASQLLAKHKGIWKYMFKYNLNLIIPDIVRKIFHNTPKKQPNLCKIHVKQITFLSCIII